MKFFNKNIELCLKKFLSIALSMSMVTFAIPIKASALDYDSSSLPEKNLLKDLLAKPPYNGKITAMVIDRPLQGVDNIPAKTFDAQVWAQLEDGTWLTGEALEKKCNSIKWDVYDVKKSQVIRDESGTYGAKKTFSLNQGTGGVGITATCNDPSQVKGDPRGVLAVTANGKNVAARFKAAKAIDDKDAKVTGKDDASHPDTLKTPAKDTNMPVKSSSGPEFGTMALLAATIVTGAAAIAVVGGGSGDSSSSSSSVGGDTYCWPRRCCQIYDGVKTRVLHIPSDCAICPPGTTYESDNPIGFNCTCNDCPP